MRYFRSSLFGDWVGGGWSGGFVSSKTSFLTEDLCLLSEKALLFFLSLANMLLIQNFNLLQVGQAVHVGALARLDLNEASVETIYLTVWTSPNVSLHLGKIENADEIKSKHAGIRLQVMLLTTNENLSATLSVCNLTL